MPTHGFRPAEMQRRMARLVARFGLRSSLTRGLVLCVLAIPGTAIAQSSATDQHRLKSIRAAGEQIKPLHMAMRPHAAGDWLASHPEAGQTFAQYLRTNPNRPTARLTTLYVQPLGEFSADQQRVLERARELLGLYYGLPIKSLTPIPLDTIPATAKRHDPAIGHEQLLTTYLLENLLPARRPADAVAVLALTPVDLWPGEGWNFVFGQGALRDRVGVHSLARYGDPDQGAAEFQLCLERTLKVAIHETGHMLGIAHCTAYECGMNGSNHLDELDRHQLAFCPECEQKLWWACRLNPQIRYEQLAKFADDNNLPAAARLWQASAERLANPH